MGTRPQQRRTYRRFCKLLRQQRLEAELTQRALAERLNKPHSYVYKCETGERRMDAIEYVEWYRACNIDGDEALFALDDLVP